MYNDTGSKTENMARTSSLIAAIGLPIRSSVVVMTTNIRTDSILTPMMPIASCPPAWGVLLRVKVRIHLGIVLGWLGFEMMTQPISNLTVIFHAKVIASEPFPVDVIEHRSDFTLRHRKLAAPHWPQDYLQEIPATTRAQHVQERAIVLLGPVHDRALGHLREK